MRRLVPFVALLVVLGCERPFIPPDATVLTETSPDLGLVQSDAVLPLRLVVSDAADVERVTVNGDEAAPAGEPGAFLDTLRLVPGVNLLVVTVFDGDGNVAEDTLYAVLAPLRPEAGAPMPAPRFEHTATLLDDGRVLVAGGYGPAESARAEAFLVTETSGSLGYADLPTLRQARAGHTTTRLPDGRALLLGGVRRDLTAAASDFVTEAELFDPATGAFTTVAVEGPAFQRYEHAALALEDEGRVYVYAYGGLEYTGGTPPVRPVGTLVVLELVAQGGTPRLITRSPPGGIGSFVPMFAHTLTPLADAGATRRAAVFGTDVTAAARVPYAQRLDFTPSAAFVPFEIRATTLAAPATALGQHAAAPYAPGLVLLSGGGVLPASSTAAPPSADLRLFAEGPERFFAYPETTRLRTPRARHTATLLASGRILLLGGVADDPAAPLAPTELLGP